MKKLVGIALITAVLFSGIVGGGFWVWSKTESQNFQSVMPSLERDKVREVSIGIDFGDGTVVSENYSAYEGDTAYYVLQGEALRKKWKLDVRHYDFGRFVNGINGYEGSKEKAWIYFVNGKSGDVAADKYILKSGDLVEWRYVKPQ